MYDVSLEFHKIGQQQKLMSVCFNEAMVSGMETSPRTSCYTEIRNGLDLVMVRLAGPTSSGCFSFCLGSRYHCLINCIYSENSVTLKCLLGLYGIIQINTESGFKQTTSDVIEFWPLSSVLLRPPKLRNICSFYQCLLRRCDDMSSCTKYEI